MYIYIPMYIINIYLYSNEPNKLADCWNISILVLIHIANPFVPTHKFFLGLPPKKT